MYEGIIKTSLLYGFEVWTLKEHERKKMEVVERNCLKNTCGIRGTDRVPNVDIKRRWGKM